MYRRQKSNVRGAAAQFKAPRMNNVNSSSPPSTASSSSSSPPASLRSRLAPNKPVIISAKVTSSTDENHVLTPSSTSPPKIKLQKRMLTPINPNTTRSNNTLIEQSQAKRIKLSTPDDEASSNNRYFEIVWRKQTMKKNKTWDGDGIAILTPTHISLRKSDSNNHYKEFSKNSKVSKFTTDDVFSMGAYEVEVMGEITDSETVAKIRGKATEAEAVTEAPNTATNKSNNISSATINQKIKPQMKMGLKSYSTVQPSRASSTTSIVKQSLTIKSSNSSTTNTSLASKQFKPMNPLSDPSHNNAATQSLHKRPKLGEPLYDATLPDSIVFNKLNDDDIDVVIDPHLAKSLRPHQVKGVKFLYDCVMGIKDSQTNGALLADDMGLGKTLQTITLLWTLLKQSPYDEGYKNPVVSKVLIACPVTLVGNWKREFKKWLPMNRVSVLTLNSRNGIARDKQDLKGFGRGRVYQVLIMGYEKIANMKDELQEIDFDILVCDEGHRLKNNSNKTLQALNSLDVQKKILLTGTPIQNDLNEFFNIIDFINPGVLGTLAHFKRHFMIPILKSREIGVMNESIIELGNDRSSELIQLTKPFILRRTAAVLAKHLPPRTDIIVFCPPTKSQIHLFHEVLSSTSFNSLLSNSGSASTLALITMFKKICNSPSLVSQDKVYTDLKLTSSHTSQLSSGKLNLLIQLLIQFHSLNEKVVIVSNYTQTLDIIQSILQTMDHTFARLDGSTPSKDRDSIVLKFNKSTTSKQFAFLLSAKSGGVGLNLIGASRLILFDSDWNPAVDLQAMARIHRDGQKKPVFIYRLLTTGTLDERIMMRQLMKGQLSERFVDEGADATDDLFEWKDLKDLFAVKLSGELYGKDKGCVMHALMGCACEGIGEVIDDGDEEEEDEENEPVQDDGQKPTIPNGFSSALMVKTVSDLNAENLDSEKSKSIKKCLVGYRHVHPSNSVEKDQDGLDLYVDYGDIVMENLIKEARTRKLISYMMWKTNKVEL
ncbi:hypothetical protein WICPIJ_003218 [Wickerhamomyces pijperi]|uniref:DNA helicase n=1 Tax=Wickerhamomyces pijperi TaxID=599730 RepID=A0A9P8TP27_WICPI|nr:hypothetical protein WICPIJ_003218 [Wickerhamomyces pijperi]